MYCCVNLTVCPVMSVLPAACTATVLYSPTCLFALPVLLYQPNYANNLFLVHYVFVLLCQPYCLPCNVTASCGVYCYCTAHSLYCL
jgi:hypothetical protein